MEENRSLSVREYHKPTHTDQYLLFDNSHPLEHKASVVRTLHHREERDHISDFLAKCGYPQWALICTGPMVKPLDAEPKKEEDRALGKQKITTAVKPMGSIKSALVHPKDKVPSRTKDNLVYEATCLSCDATYIGETQHPLHKRVYQHAAPNLSSAIADHTRQTGHRLSLANF